MSACFEIYLFSHDPIGQFKIYESFEQLILDNIIAIQIEFDDIELTRDEEIQLKKKFVPGDNIDYEMRYLKI